MRGLLVAILPLLLSRVQPSDPARPGRLKIATFSSVVKCFRSFLICSLVSLTEERFLQLQLRRDNSTERPPNWRLESEFLDVN